MLQYTSYHLIYKSCKLIFYYKLHQISWSAMQTDLLEYSYFSSSFLGHPLDLMSFF